MPNTIELSKGQLGQLSRSVLIVLSEIRTIHGVHDENSGYPKRGYGYNVGFRHSDHRELIDGFETLDEAMASRKKLVDALSAYFHEHSRTA